ncbi:hypothetical protein [Salinispora arenicola]|nr:hypothetical protein [Salinispora arenicola]
MQPQGVQGRGLLDEVGRRPRQRRVGRASDDQVKGARGGVGGELVQVGA